MRVSLLTPSLPERQAQLYETLQSVVAQTMKPAEHRIAVDWERNGCSFTLNSLASSSGSSWIAILADDDLLYPNHLQTLCEAAKVSGADIVYSQHDWVDNETPGLARPYDAERLKEGNFIPATVLMRWAVWDHCGGWDDREDEDYGMWLKASQYGFKFHFVDEVTWTYRPSGGTVKRPPAST